MLPAESPLRCLPAFADREDTVMLQALVFASDVMSVALKRLDECASAFDAESGDPAAPAAMLSDAWIIVDQVHAARQLFAIWRRKDPNLDPSIQAFIDRFNVAHTLRNKMEHLSGSLSNHANSKRATSPLFGSLSFFRPFPEKWEEGHERGRIDGQIVMVCAGNITHRTNTTVFFKEISYRLPIGGLKLEAFGSSFMIEEAVGALDEILRRQADIMPEYTAFVVNDLVTKHGVTLEEATRQSIGSPTVYAKSFDVTLPLQNRN